MSEAQTMERALAPAKVLSMTERRLQDRLDDRGEDLERKLAEANAGAQG